MDELTLEPIAYIKTDFPEKFGVPRQSGIVQELLGRIVFQPQFKNGDCLREIEGYSHLWLIWGFSKNDRSKWSPTVRPPMLGGNRRVGVFASRSPFRPNPLGLSCVRLCRVENGELIVSGADMVDNTPIYDIKPYISYSDSHPEALSGFAVDPIHAKKEVVFLQDCEKSISQEVKLKLEKVLSQDPHPSYKTDKSRIYKMGFSDLEIAFSCGSDAIEVHEIKKGSSK